LPLFKPFYPTRIIALVAADVGNVTVNVLSLDVFSEPKSNTATAGVVPPDLYINAPRAVIEELVHDESEKSKYATVPLVAVSLVGFVAIVNVLPPAVYPVPDASLVVEYTVVVASKVASVVYNAILKD
tara:strand:- start:864 stop:1247 length:384 start_codon:yes stop_codon:yes gene_type:complete